MLDNENSNGATTANTTEDLIAKPHFHAVIVTGGEVKVISNRVRSKLVKQLDEIGDYTLVGVIKGKFMKTRHRQALELV